MLAEKMNPKAEGEDSLDGSQETRKRKKISRACLPCQRSHCSCDESRPCKRCIHRGLSKECVDGIKRAISHTEKTSRSQPISETNSSLLLLAATANQQHETMEQSPKSSRESSPSSLGLLLAPVAARPAVPQVSSIIRLRQR